MHDEEDPDAFDESGPSKTQRKRDMQALRDLGQRLTEIPEDQLLTLPEPRLVEAVQASKKISRGSARKRQAQFIGKLLRDEALADAARELVDRFDSASQVHVAHFHQLERWRDRLLQSDESVMSEIATEHPDVDRQHLRQLARKAIDEAAREAQPPVNFRKLFQYLKSLGD